MSENELQSALRVERGNPSAEELAAIVAIVQSAIGEERAAGKKQIRQPRSTWNRNQQQMRGGIVAGFGQWTASFRDGLN